MSLLRPKTIILSAQSVRPIEVRPKVYGDGGVFYGKQTVTDYDSFVDDDDDDVEVIEFSMPQKRRRLTFLSPEEKLVRRFVRFLLILWDALCS